MASHVKDLAKKTFQVLNLSGIARIDFLIDKKSNIIYVDEPNTIPGSLAFYLWQAENISYKNLLDEVISLTIDEYKNIQNKISSFETNILSNMGSKQSLKGITNNKLS